MATITAMPPRRPLTTSTTYTLAHTAQCKLKLAANRPDRNLRFVLGHAFTLDNLMLRIVEIENRSAKSMFEEATSGGGGNVHYDCTAGVKDRKSKPKPDGHHDPTAAAPEPAKVDSAHDDGRGRRISFQDNNARPSSIGSGAIGIASTNHNESNHKNTVSSPARKRSPPPVSAPPRNYLDEEDDEDDTSSDDYDEPDTYQIGNANKATKTKSPDDTRRVQDEAYSDEEDDPYDDDMGGGLMRFESASAQPPRMVRSGSDSSSSEEEEDDGPVTPPQLPADVDLRELISGEKDVELEGLYESVRGCACHGHREDGDSADGVWDVPIEKSPEGRRLAVVSVAA